LNLEGSPIDIITKKYKNCGSIPKSGQEVLGCQPVAMRIANEKKGLIWEFE
jgi:hypothetical protein